MTKFHRTLIRPAARMDYDSVNECLLNDSHDGVFPVPRESVMLVKEKEIAAATTAEPEEICHAKTAANKDKRNTTTSATSTFKKRLLPTTPKEILQHLAIVTKSRREQRLQSGGLTLNFGNASDEVVMEFDQETGWPTRFEFVSNGTKDSTGKTAHSVENQHDKRPFYFDSHRIIEELMVLANHVVAKKLLQAYQHKTMQRIHPDTSNQIRKQLLLFLHDLVAKGKDGRHVASRSAAETNTTSTREEAASEAGTKNAPQCTAETMTMKQKIQHFLTGVSIDGGNTGGSTSGSNYDGCQNATDTNNPQPTVEEILQFAQTHLPTSLAESVTFSALQALEKAEYKMVDGDEETTIQNADQDQHVAEVVDHQADKNTSTASCSSSSTSSTATTFHWGLNLEGYLHFTSPIRRYADIIVHRMLARAVGNEYEYEKAVARPAAAEDTEVNAAQNRSTRPPAISESEWSDLQQITARCTDYSRRQDDAAADCRLWYFAEFLRRQPLPERGVELVGVVWKIHASTRYASPDLTTTSTPAAICSGSSTAPTTPVPSVSTADGGQKMGGAPAAMASMNNPAVLGNGNGTEDSGSCSSQDGDDRQGRSTTTISTRLAEGSCPESEVDETMAPAVPTTTTSKVEFFLPQLRHTKAGTVESLETTSEILSKLSIGEQVRLVAKPTKNSLIEVVGGGGATTSPASNCTGEFKNKALWSLKLVE
ncbi:unnamed protein product [Amoebophrya sp. A120]|nr:unnamed protein product [Amoebophrya sp. A120]|eukprot:GSA120T00025628001.1